MPPQYLPLFVFLVMAAVLPIASLSVFKLLRPSRPNPTKAQAYECGIETATDSRGRFNVRFYLVAIIFVIFDAETIFLFPWAVQYRALGWFGVAEVTIFLLILFAGYLWAYRQGALEWN